MEDIENVRISAALKSTSGVKFRKTTIATTGKTDVIDSFIFFNKTLST